MKSYRCLLLAGAALVVFLASARCPAAAQGPGDPKMKQAESRKEAIKKVIDKAQEEYRIFFKEPKSVLEYWAAMKFEMQVGKFDVAAYHLDKLLQVKMPEPTEKEPNPPDPDQELLQIEELEGLNALLNLKGVKQWSKNKELDQEARKNVELLIDRTMALVEKKLGDQVRLKYFIDNLNNEVPEARNFALNQVLRAKYRATPLLVEELRVGKKNDLIKATMLKLDREAIPPLFETLRARGKGDAEDKHFRLALLYILRNRYEKRAIPYLWHMSEAAIYPLEVRLAAKETLAALLDMPLDRLPPAKVALVKLAEDYYQHKVRFPNIIERPDPDNPTRQLVLPAYDKWYVNEEGRIASKAEVLTPDEARFQFGMRYAKEALDLDKKYLPAQVVYLSFILEEAFADKPYDRRLDRLVMEKRPPALQRLLAKIDFDLLLSVLDRAMREHNYAVMVPLIDALGERGETRAALPTSANSPGPLVEALYFPDRRVQYSAARALLKLPGSQSPVASARVVEILRRFLAADPAPKVLIVFAKDARAAELRQAVEAAGFQADVAPSTKDAILKLHRSAEYDAILLDDAVSTGELPFVVSQLRGDADAGLLPLLVIAPPERKGDLARAIERSRNTFLIESVLTKQAGDLKKQILYAIKVSAAPDTVRNAPPEQRSWLDYEIRRTKGQMLSDEERKYYAQAALDWFAEMARGEITGYNLKPVKDTLEQLLNVEGAAKQALRILARFPDSDTQKRLYGVLINPQRAALHLEAAKELNRHIQKNGMWLTPDQIAEVRTLEGRKDVAPALRGELSILVGTLGSTPGQTGTRLFYYRPDPAQPPPEKGEK